MAMKLVKSVDAVLGKKSASKKGVRVLKACCQVRLSSCRPLAEAEGCAFRQTEKIWGLNWLCSWSGALSAKLAVQGCAEPHAALNMPAGARLRGRAGRQQGLLQEVSHLRGALPAAQHDFQQPPVPLLPAGGPWYDPCLQCSRPVGCRLLRGHVAAACGSNGLGIFGNANVEEAVEAGLCCAEVQGPTNYDTRALPAVRKV